MTSSSSRESKRENRAIYRLYKRLYSINAIPREAQSLFLSSRNERKGTERRERERERERERGGGGGGDGEEKKEKRSCRALAVQGYSLVPYSKAGGIVPELARARSLALAHKAQSSPS